MKKSFLPIIITGLIVLVNSINYTICAQGSQKKKQSIVNFSNDQLLIDASDAGWEYFAQPAGDAATSMYGMNDAKEDVTAELEKVVNVKKWSNISVGRRWESMGMPQLNGRPVWLRLKFIVPEEMKKYKVGFFCTAFDDLADFFINGKYLGQKSYIWGSRIPEPVNIDLTDNLKLGQENTLIIRLKDLAPARPGGILGNVMLYRTLPFTRTGTGGLVINNPETINYSVVLHLGDGLMSKGIRTSFTADELKNIEVPPYILREDEIIIVSPAEIAKQKPEVHLVDLDNVSPVIRNATLSIKCQEFPSTVELYGRLTIPLEVSATFNNPFNSRQINIQAVIETPSGKTEKVPAFFSQDFEPVSIGEEEEILLPVKGNPWKLNYRPRETGSYKFHVIAQDKNGTKRTADLKFDVIASDRKGYLRVSKNDPRYFEFDNGDPYFGIGPSGWLRNSLYIFGGNPRWISTRILDKYYEAKAASGSNFDYCLAEFFGRFYIRGGFMDQHVTWKIEHRIRKLEELGIYWVTCYDDICRSVVYGLNTLPYSEAQGGPCRNIEDLYFNETSIDMQKEHIRYFVSRVSDSPALAVWAIGDESQMGSRFSPLMVNLWIKDLQNYVRTIDVYQHPHIFGEGPLSIVNGGDAVIIPDWYFTKMSDEVLLTLNIMEKYNKISNSPLINPEGGMVEWTKPEDQYGPRHPGYYLTGERWKFPEAISFHNHLWISFFTKNAVGGTEWLGQWIYYKNELYHATAMKNYIEGEPIARMHLEMASPELSNADLRGFCLQSENKTLVWVQNRFYNWLDAGHNGKTPPVISGATISIPVKSTGNFNIELWDTRTGKIVSTTKSATNQHIVKYPLPPVQKDIALKVIKQD